MFQAQNKLSGTIFNIQSFSLDDGPGIRDVVFLKGCSLSCAWCSNPESINNTPEICHKAQHCIGTEECGLCVKACQVQAISVKGTLPLWDRNRCNACGACSQACPAKAVHLMGYTISVDALCERLHSNDNLFRNAEGGITLSGGEPLLQPTFATAIVQRMQHEGIHCAIETAGFIPQAALDMICPHLDLLIFDLKHVDEQAFLQNCKGKASHILQNLQYIANKYPHLPLWVRTPVIPQFNDDEASITRIATVIGNLAHVEKHQLLPYHRFGEGKYTQLGRPYALAHIPSLTEERVQYLQNVADTARNRVSKKREA